MLKMVMFSVANQTVVEHVRCLGHTTHSRIQTFQHWDKQHLRCTVQVPAALLKQDKTKVSNQTIECKHQIVIGNTKLEIILESRSMCFLLNMRIPRLLDCFVAHLRSTSRTSTSHQRPEKVQSTSSFLIQIVRCCQRIIMLMPINRLISITF